MHMPKNSEKGITMITLAVTIIVLIILAGVSMTTLLGDNGIITKAKEARENILYAGQEEQEQLNQLYWELEQNGTYTEDEEDTKKDQMIQLLQKQVEELKQQVADLQGENTELEDQVANLNGQIEDLNKQISDLKAEVAEKDIQIEDFQKEVALKQETINNLQGQLDSINSQLAQTNATAAHILKDYKAYSGGQLVVGTMPNNGAVSASLNAGQSYTIPEGYHNGSGKVTANSLTNQTQGTANANNISSGKTAWVNGQLVTGNGTDVNNAYNQGYNEGKKSSTITILNNVSASLSNGYAYFYINNLYSDYQNLTIDNIHIECCGLITATTGAGRLSSDGLTMYSWNFSYNSSNGIISVRTSDSAARNYAQMKANIIIIK